MTPAVVPGEAGRQDIAPEPPSRTSTTVDETDELETTLHAVLFFGLVGLAKKTQVVICDGNNEPIMGWKEGAWADGTDAPDPPDGKSHAPPCRFAPLNEPPIERRSGEWFVPSLLRDLADRKRRRFTSIAYAHCGHGDQADARGERIEAIEYVDVSNGMGHVGPMTGYVGWVIVHVTLPFDLSGAGWKKSVRTLSRLVSAKVKLKDPESTARSPILDVLRQNVVYTIQEGGAKPHTADHLRGEAGTTPVLIPNGGIVFANGPEFYKEPPLDLADFTTIDASGNSREWSAQNQWLWWLSETVPVGIRRDAPAGLSNDDVFDVMGRACFVGRNLVVMLSKKYREVPMHLSDGRRNDTKWDCKKSQTEWFLRSQFTDVMLLGMIQRHRLYALADRLVNEDGESMGSLQREAFRFRQRYWWEHVESHPAGMLLRQFQRYHRLPELMNQLVSEANDYRGRQLNRSVIILTVLTVAIGGATAYGTFAQDLQQGAVALLVALGISWAIVSGLHRLMRGRNGRLFHPPRTLGRGQR